MKRELKFRRWNKHLEDMIYSEKELGKFFNIIDFYPTHYFIMQYTGLKDKNGIEVYEGDIVKLLNGNRVFEYFKNSFWLIEPIERLFKFPIGLLSEDTARDMEIVGNIYENPELLKKEL